LIDLGVARFGLVTLRRRTEAPGPPILRELMQEVLRDDSSGGEREVDFGL